jgi:hypothetical protein
MEGGRFDALVSGVWSGIPALGAGRGGPVEEPLHVVEAYRGHSIVVHDGAWLGISQGYRAFTRDRLARRFYRRVVVAPSLDGVKRALDRMPYPHLLWHARIAVDALRGIGHRAAVGGRGLGDRLLRGAGFPAQRLAGKVGRRLRAAVGSRLRAPSGQPR